MQLLLLPPVVGATRIQVILVILTTLRILTTIHMWLLLPNDSTENQRQWLQLQLRQHTRFCLT